MNENFVKMCCTKSTVRKQLYEKFVRKIIVQKVSYENNCTKSDTATFAQKITFLIFYFCVRIFCFAEKTPLTVEFFKNLFGF